MRICIQSLIVQAWVSVGALQAQHIPYPGQPPVTYGLTSWSPPWHQPAPVPVLKGIEHPGVPALIRIAPQERAESLKRAWIELQAALGSASGPAEADLLYARATLWLDLGNRDGAIRDLAHIARLGTAADKVGQVQSAAAVRARLTAALAVASRPEFMAEARSALRYGVTALQYHETETALRWFDDAVQLQPAAPLNWYYRALARYASGDLTAAARDAKVGAYLEHRENNGQRDNLIAQALTDVQGQRREWLERYRRADLTAQTDTVESESRRSARYVELDKDAMAMAMGRVTPGARDTELPPEVRLLPADQRRDWLKVAAALKSSPEMPELYAARAQLWQAAYNYEQALRDIIKAEELARTRQVGRASPLDGTARPLSRPLEQLDRMPVPPHRAAAVEYYAAGQTAFHAADFSHARTVLSDAIHSDPLEPLHWYFRALTLYRLGDYAKARQDARIGAVVESRNASPAGYDYGRHMERVQGGLRKWLESVRSGSPE